jgi:ABC-type glutathione transport system ATPase component
MMSTTMEAPNASPSTPAVFEEEKTLSTRPATPPRLSEDGDAPPHEIGNGIRPVVTNASAASHGENAISLREVDPVSVRLEGLSVTVDQSPNFFRRVFGKNAGARDGLESHVKTILDNISVELSSGSLTAIIGGSGSGKTSLLNQMSGRMKGNRLSSTGRTLFNGNEDASTIRSALVIQQDLLLPTLTVRETLMYAAQLRLPPSISQDERKQLVEEVILELSLKEAADTRIGNHEHRGCSGGEKRRTSIGVQVGKSAFSVIKASLTKVTATIKSQLAMAR